MKITHSMFSHILLSLISLISGWRCQHWAKRGKVKKSRNEPGKQMTHNLTSQETTHVHILANLLSDFFLWAKIFVRLVSYLSAFLRPCLLIHREHSPLKTAVPLRFQERLQPATELRKKKTVLWGEKHDQKKLGNADLPLRMWKKLSDVFNGNSK